MIRDSIKKNTANRFGSAALSLLLFLLTGVLGCATVGRQATVVSREDLTAPSGTPATIEGDALSLAMGRKAFREGAFRKAAKLFQALEKEAAEVTIRRRALYGLACSRLMLANNPEGVAAALSLLDRWDGLAPDQGRAEDPRMLRTAMAGAGENRYARLLRATDGEIRRLKKRLDRMQTENATLQHQIEALDAIHRNIEEKKRDISSP